MASAIEILSKIRILNLVVEPLGLLGEPSGRRFNVEPLARKPREPFSWSGGFAVVCPAQDEAGRKRALRFFTAKTPPHQTQITSFLSQNRHSALVSGKMYRKALSLKSGEDVDMMEMDFVDGLNLEDEVASRIRSGRAADLAVLAENFRTMVIELAGIGFYHGDLSHTNVLVEGGELRLIDYDSVFIHGANNPPEGEAGHPCFQHHSRNKSRFTRLEDVYFSALVIYISLHALAKSTVLWDEYHSKDDNLIFQHNRNDLKETSTPLWNDLGGIEFDEGVGKCLDVLRQAVQSQDLLVGDFRSRIEDTFASGFSPPSPIQVPQPLPPRPPSRNKPVKTQAVVQQGKRWLTRGSQAKVQTGRTRIAPVTKIQKGSRWLRDSGLESDSEPKHAPESDSEPKHAPESDSEPKHAPEPEPTTEPPGDGTLESESPINQDGDEEELTRLEKMRSILSKLKIIEERKAELAESEAQHNAWDDGWNIRSNSAPMSADQMIIIDASNIIRMASPPKIRTLVSLVDYLSSLGLSNIRSIADPTLRHIVEDRDEYELMNNDDPFFTQSPRGVPADVPILEHGLDLEAAIVTNDAFRDHRDTYTDEYNWFESHHLQVSLMDGNWAIIPKIEIIPDEEE